jgi:hypothetical protein
MRPRIPILAAAVVVWLAPAGVADDSDGPGRGVARISVINGDVSVRRGDSGDWLAAAPNAPLVVQDRVLTGAASRAEVQFDYANFVRLASQTELRLTELEHRRYQMQLAQGTVNFRVLRDSDADVEVSTPAVSVRPRKRGIYRISVRDNGETEVTVRSGEVEVFTPTGVESLRSGRTMLARATASATEVQMIAEIPEDDFDRWSVNRDRDLERSGAYRYVHRDVYGAEELDYHGSWVHVDTYGWVWQPRVHVDWAPYRHGRWAWVDWYGWTWVSYDPWGWAPYHYGRWFHHGRHGWCWYPGGFRSRHYWRPALVAFFGVGPVHVGFGFGRVGWVPLAPYEPYYPWYGRRYYSGYRNRTFVDNSVNVVNNINITNVYRNSRVRNAVTALDGGDFARGRAGNFVRINEQDFRGARVVRGQVPVTPERSSLRLTDREARAIGRDGGDGRFFARRQPAAVERISFDEQRQGMERVSRRLSEGGVRTQAAGARPERAARDAGTARVEDRGWRAVNERATLARAGEENTARQEPAQSRGWRRFGEPRSGTTTRTTGTGGSENSEGWRGFGTPSAADGAVRREGAGEPRVSRESTRSIRDNESDTVRRDGAETWRRLGQTGETRGARTGSSDTGASRPGEPRDRRTDGNWRRFGDLPRDQGELRLTPRRESRSSDSGRERPEPPGTSNMERGGRGERRSESPGRLQISPPVVRERSGRSERGNFGGSTGAPRMERRDGGFSRSGGEMRAPRGGGGTPRMQSGGASRGSVGGSSRGSGGGSVRGGGGGRSR